MSLPVLLLILLLVAWIAVWPCWAHSQRWGYGPSGLLGLALLGLVALLLTGRLEP